MSTKPGTRSVCPPGILTDRGISELLALDKYPVAETLAESP